MGKLMPNPGANCKKSHPHPERWVFQGIQTSAIFWYSKIKLLGILVFLTGGAPSGFQHFTQFNPYFALFICIVEGYEIIIVHKISQDTSELPILVNCNKPLVALWGSERIF